MNKCSILLCFFMLCYGIIIAQNQPVIEDSLLRKELLMTKYKNDTSADAVILSDIGSVSILIDPNMNNFRKYYTVNERIKIFSESGFSNGTWSIPLLGKGNYADEVLRLKATTYNLIDGKIVSTPLNESDIHYEKDSKYFTIEKFALPDIKIGSVISVSYTIKSEYINYFDWIFQHKIPVEYSQFTVTIPPFYSYMSFRQAIDTSKLIYTKWQDSVAQFAFRYCYYNSNFKYIYKDLPAFKEQAFISCPRDYLTKVIFQLSEIKGWRYSHSYISTWKDLNTAFLSDEYFGGYIESKWGVLGKNLEELNIDNQSQTKKIKAIVNYVKYNYKWNNIYSYMASQEMGDFIKRKIGNSADINLCLIAMLRIAHIDAEPVILSTREHGKIKIDYPFINYFNDVICYVKTDSNVLLLDATQPMLPYNTLPSQCMNGSGLVVQNNDIQWVDLQSNVSSLEVKKMTLKISPNYDSLNTEFIIKANGYRGFQYRKEWEEGYDKFIKILTIGKGAEINDSVKTYNIKNPEEAVSIVYSASSPIIRQKMGSGTGYRIIFSPFLNEPLQENPLKMPDRTYPVDMNYLSEYEYQSILVIPDGYKIKEEPTEMEQEVLNGKAIYSYKIKKITNNVIQFSSDLSFKETIFQPKDYTELKNFYDLVIKKYKEPIILEKN